MRSSPAHGQHSARRPIVSSLQNARAFALLFVGAIFAIFDMAAFSKM